MAYATLAKVHERLNIADSVTAPDTKIASYILEADGYCNTQINLHASTPITNDDELDGLANGLAAAIYVYWTTPDKKIDGIREYKKQISEFVKAKYGRKNVDGLSALAVTKTASKITGKET
jgi:hypothetical protein